MRERGFAEAEPVLDEAVRNRRRAPNQEGHHPNDFLFCVQSLFFRSEEQVQIEGDLGGEGKRECEKLADHFVPLRDKGLHVVALPLKLADCPHQPHELKGVQRDDQRQGRRLGRQFALVVVFVYSHKPSATALVQDPEQRDEGVEDQDFALGLLKRDFVQQDLQTLAHVVHGGDRNKATGRHERAQAAVEYGYWR